MKSGRSGALKPDRLGLSCKAINCSDAGTGDLSVLPTHDIRSMKDVASTIKSVADWPQHEFNEKFK